MSKSRLIFLIFLFVPFFINSQDNTPFVVYEFDKDPDYKMRMLTLKKLEKRSPSIKTFIIG